MVANLSALVNNVSVQVTALDTHETVDGRTAAKLTIYDAPGTAVYEPRTPVLITDSLTGYSFSGYVNDDQTAPDANGVAIWHTLACVDESDLASKRYYSGTEWQNRYAGDISTDIVESTLSAEGVTANFATDEDNGVGDWQEGTQTNTAGVQTATGGALELALAGKIVTKSESIAADWNAGTLTGAMVSGNLLQLNAHPALSFSGTCSSGYGNAYAYYRIWSGSYSIPISSFLAYKVWINSDSPAIMAGIDGVCTDGTSIRDFNSAGGTDPNFYLLDQNRMRAHPNTDLSGFANDQWYYRYIDLTTIAGKTLSSITVVFEGDSAGTYQAYFYDVQIQNNTGGVLLSFYGSSGALGTNHIIPNLSSKVSNVGYSNVQITPVTGYESTGTRISGGNSMQLASIYQSSLLNWIATVPTNTALAVYTSVDGGATYQPATNQTAISNIPLGAPLTSRNVSTKIVMSISGKDPTATPQVSNITWTVNPAYAATQTATRQKYDTQTDWTTSATLTNTVATSGGDLTINSSQRDWNDEQVTSQTLFGGGVDALQGISKRAASLRASTGQVAQSRLDFAGTWQNFTTSIDVQVPAANVFVGITYRTTFWDNNPNTEAYLVDLSTTSFNFGRGTNNATNTHFAIQTQALTLNPGEWHTITITTSGTTHNISLDGVNYWGAVTDANFTAAGSFGLRIYNNTAGDYTTYYDNFGVMDSSGIYPGPGTFSGPTWVSPSISLGSFTAGNNLIFWDASTIAGDYLNVQTNFNGAGYTNATNGSPIPGIVSGTAYVSATLQVKVQMQAATAADTPSLHGLTVWVTSLYNSTGNRISVPLSLASVGTAGNTAISWQGVQPANTAILVDTSLDGTNWSNAGIGASGQATIAGILTQTDPVVDSFSTDTSNNYTSTSRTGGSVASWVWDSAHNRLTVSGGVNAHLLYNSPTTGANVDISAVLDTSDNGGFVWRWLDQGDHYSLAIHDSASPNNPNTAQLYVVTGGGGGTITPLTEYETSVTSATVGTMKQLSKTLGTGAFTTKQSTIGTSTGYGELFAASTTNAWAAGSALLDPSTNNAGWIDDGITLEGQTLAAGVYSPTVRLALNATATITADIYVLYFKRSSGGTYTPIGNCVLASQTITSSLATYNLSGSLPGMSFATGDKLTRMVQLNITSNTNGLGTLACKIGMASAANTGIVSAQDVTPGFQLTGTGGATTLLNQAAMSFTRNSPHVFRVVMVGPNITITMDGNPLITTGDTTITAAGFAGFRNDNAGGASSAQFYLFRLQYYGQNVANAVVLSRVRFTSTDPTATPQLNQYSMSVHDPSIQEGALIPQTSYSILGGNKKTVAAIYDDLASQSGNFWWKIISFQLFFQQHQATPAPWVLTPQGATGVDIVDSLAPTLDNINDTYRNSQWGTGGTDIIPQTRSFVGNGTQTTFDLGYNVDTITSITLGGAVQTFGIANSSTGMNWYYTQGQSAIIQDTSAVPISGASQVLTVAFNAQVTISVNVQSPSEVTRVGNLDNTTGIIDEGEDMSGLNKAAMMSKCAGLLTQFGQKSKTLTFTTRRSGLAVGQLQCAFVGPLGVFAGAFLLTDIKGTWRAEGVGDGTVMQQATFAVSGTSGPITLNWQRFVDSLGRAK